MQMPGRFIDTCSHKVISVNLPAALSHEEPIMLCRFTQTCFVILLAAIATDARADDDKKTDRDTKVTAGTEFTLTPVTVTIADKPFDTRRFEATVKEGKEATKVKMPAEKWFLGISGSPAKGGGVTVGDSLDDTGMKAMRTVAGKGDEPGPWQADPGDIITHVNGYAVKSIEEIICAVSLAKDKTDVQIILKDVSTDKVTVFYVTATKS